MTGREFDACEIAVIGGGVIGCFTAYYLSGRGKNIVLLERGDIGSGASGANDAMIMAQSKHPGPKLATAIRSYDIWEHLSDELGMDIEYKRNGSMIELENEEEIQLITTFSQSQREFGLQVEFLDQKRTREAQPALASHILGSTFCPTDGEVNPFLVLVGLVRKIQANGGRVYTHTPVTGFDVEDGRITGVLTNKGMIRASTVICAAGAYSPKIGELLDISIPIRPQRGQVLITEPIPPLVGAYVISGRTIANKYRPAPPRDAKKDEENNLVLGTGISQTKSGNMILGGTYEFVEYDTRTNVRGVTAIAANTSRIIPALKEVKVIRTFSGLRPYTADGLPIVGPSDKISNFIIAAGHYGDGIAMSPATGKEVSEKVIQGVWP